MCLSRVDASTGPSAVEKEGSFGQPISIEIGIRNPTKSAGEKRVVRRGWGQGVRPGESSHPVSLAFPRGRRASGRRRGARRNGLIGNHSRECRRGCGVVRRRTSGERSATQPSLGTGFGCSLSLLSPRLALI